MNRGRLILGVMLAAVLAACSFPASAWGPAARQAIVSTAMHVISKEGPVQLNKLDKEVMAGIMAPPEVVASIYPGLATSPVRAVEAEMSLLAGARGSAVEPYLAFRLGVLGVIVADMTGPLATSNSPYRKQYFGDVDAGIGRVTLMASERKKVDPMTYFARVQGLANTHSAMILKDYQEGAGFNGLAKAALSEDASRSVDGVADVWATVLTGTAVHAGISDAEMREYVVSAMEFYIKRQNVREIDANYKRLSTLTTMTADLSKRIADMMYDAGLYERAIEAYRAVLATDPSRRDVVEKIAEYYIKQGDTALDAKHLQQAYESYALAAKTNPLHPGAEGKRLQVERMISERDARLESVRRQIEEAGKFQTQAEQLAMQRKPADAITVLKQAQHLYEGVNDEFSVEYEAASVGLTNISGRLRELKGELIQNAQSLSGSGTTFDAKRLASNAKALDEQALEGLVNKQLDTQLGKMKTKYQAALEIKP